MADRTRVALVGCAGRMGRAVAELLAEQPDMTLVAGVEVKGHPAVGQKCGSGVVAASLAEVIESCDVVVDFSAASVAAENAGLCATRGRAYVSGVTGLSDAQHASLRDAAKKTAVVHASNFSVGVSVLSKLVREAAKLLGSGYDIEVIETHHRQKKDAPSGTAKLLVDTLKDATGRTEVVHGREGMVGEKPAGQIGVSSIRTGSVVGEHVVVFGGTGERVELVHKAESRMAFASGVIAAIRFVRTARPGLYGIAEVLSGL